VAIADPIASRVLLFGGRGETGSFNDLWSPSMSGGDCTELTPAGTPPSPRSGHSAVYDPDLHRVIVFGGRDVSTYWNNVQILSLSGIPTWSEMQPTGIPPQERFGHSAIFDPIGNRMIVFGGNSDGNLGDAWQLSLSGGGEWSPLALSGFSPSARHGHSAVYHPGQHQMILFGGYLFENDVWALTLGAEPAWTELSPTGMAPPGRFGHAAIYDPGKDRLVIFAGEPARNDVWALTLSGDPAWTHLNPGGVIPAGRAEIMAVPTGSEPATRGRQNLLFLRNRAGG
jgi:hypothetical protein